jgi:hypothetical protein
VPVVKGGDAGLVTIWNEHGLAISPWRTALAKWAPRTLTVIENHQPPLSIAQGATPSRTCQTTCWRCSAPDTRRRRALEKALPELSTEIPAILIKLGGERVEPDANTGRAGRGYHAGLTLQELYETVRGAWVLDPQRAEGFRYAVAVHDGVTLAAWEFTPASWTATPSDVGGPTRWSFEGTPAAAEVVDAFVGQRGKRIPRFRSNGSNVFGSGNPIAYWP